MLTISGFLPGFLSGCSVGVPAFLLSPPLYYGCYVRRAVWGSLKNQRGMGSLHHREGAVSEKRLVLSLGSFRQEQPYEERHDPADV